MASVNRCIASLGRLTLAPPARKTAVSTIPSFLLPGAIPSAVRFAGAGGMRKRPTRKKKVYKTFRSHDQTPMQKFSLCDAMRYIRAFEVGNPPASVKYDVAVKFRSGKNGPVIKNRVKLPYAIKGDTRIGVICPEDSPLKTQAEEYGAVVAGEESVFQKIREGIFDFNKLICHAESEEALKKANLGKLLGPKGLMPNRRMGTITHDIKKTMDDMVGTTDFRERDRVVRVAVGQLGFTPKMLADNLKVLMEKLKQEAVAVEDSGHTKKVEEVVLGSTHGPGFSLDGKMNPTEEDLQIEQLQTPM